MTIFVEHLARPVPPRALARLVAGSIEHGPSEIALILRSLGLEHLPCASGALGHAYAVLAHKDVVRAMHAGAVPVERDEIESLLNAGHLPFGAADEAHESTARHIA